jgi:uncharacterized phage-associated protein
MCKDECCSIFGDSKKSTITWQLLDITKNIGPWTLQIKKNSTSQKALSEACMTWLQDSLV